MSNSTKSEVNGQTLQDKEIVAQGSIEYNGRNLAYIVSKSGSSYFLDVSFVVGSKQSDNEKKVRFEFERKDDGKYYLNLREAPFLHRIFIEENGEKSMVLVNGNKEIMKLSTSQDGTILTVMGQKMSIPLNERGMIIDINALAGGLNTSEIKKINSFASKLFALIEERTYGIHRHC